MYCEFESATMPQQELHEQLTVSDRDRDTEFELLIEASEIAAKFTLDFNALMAELAKLVRKLVDYQMYALMLPTSEGDLQIRYSIGYGERLENSLRIPIGQGLTGRAAESLTTVFVKDVNLDPSYLRAVDAVRCEVAVPLVARGRLVAVLDLQSANPNAFDGYAQPLLELIASRFSLAIDVSQLYQSQAKQHSTLQTLQKIAQDFSQILNLDELLQRLSTLVRTLISYEGLAIYLNKHSNDELRHYFGVKHKQRVEWKDVKFGQGIVGRSAELREPILVEDTSQDPYFIPISPSMRSAVTIPLILKSEIVGVLYLESEQLACFNSEDVHTLMLLAPQVAAAIENARLYEEKALNESRLEGDLIAARALQSHLLPHGHRHYSGIEVAARNEPAALVSGDLYDFYTFGNYFGLFNGDVSGKGAAAALYAALVSGLFRNIASMQLSPAETLRRVNKALVARKIEARFLAALYMVWDPENKRLTLAGAGQPRPFVYRSGRFEKIELEGIPLGLFANSSYEEAVFDLQPGDMVVCYSDGFSESFNAAGEDYGEERLMHVLEHNKGESALLILEQMFESVSSFSAGAPPSDDRTAVILRVTH